jgi:putative membrane protein
MSFLVKVLVTTLSVIIGAYLMPGVEVESFTTALVVAFVLGILNAILKPILIILTIPVTVITLGLFLLVINAFIIMITSHLVSGFTVDSFWIAIIFSIILSVINWILSIPAK